MLERVHELCCLSGVSPSVLTGSTVEVRLPRTRRHRANEVGTAQPRGADLLHHSGARFTLTQPFRPPTESTRPARRRGSWRLPPRSRDWLNGTFDTRHAQAWGCRRLLADIADQHDASHRRPAQHAHRYEPHFLYRCQSTYSMVVAGRDPNTEAFRELRDAGVDVKWAPSRVIGRAHKMPTISPIVIDISRDLG